MEILKKIWKKTESKQQKKVFPEDLKELIIKHQEKRKSIKGLKMDMELVASDHGQRYTLDKGLINKYKQQDEQLVGEIFYLCKKYEIDPSRFLSSEEISRFSGDASEEKRKAV